MTNDDGADELPDAVRRLWQLDPPAGSSRPGLTVGRIVTAAIAVADAEGLEAVSMARVAKELGFTTMALYRHVGSKDELLELMLDGAAGEPPPLPDGAAWREATEAWSYAQFRALSRHPWITEVPIRGIPMSPNRVRWIEQGLQALRDSGLAPVERFALIGTIASHVLQEVSLVRQLTEHAGGRPWAEVEREYARNLRMVIDADRFPELSALIAGDGFESPPSDAPDEIDSGFVFGLARLLDGVELHVQRSRNGSGGQAASQ